MGRGDWGLKRPLPLKSTTRTSTPHIFVENVDSIDHITDFGSAADHTRTLEKWQEMGLSLSRHGQNETEALQSVFEAYYDNTDTSITDSEQHRWKFQGPWLGVQSHGEFAEYVERKVKRRRPEFRQYLKEVLAQETLAARRRENMENGPEEASISELGQTTSIVSDLDLDVFVKRLRKKPEILDKYIQAFLDLPRESRHQKASAEHKDIRYIGPPSTHPSAGLAYLRSHSHTVNHPVLGPQENKPPVEARVLLPQADVRGHRPFAIFGIGGIATQDSRKSFTKSGEEDQVANFIPDIPGGGKIWLQLRKATVTPQGRIEIGNQRADKNALIAAGVDKPLTLPPAYDQAAQMEHMPDLLRKPTQNRNTQSYGVESLGSLPKSERAVPLDGNKEILNTLSMALESNKRRF